MLYALLWELLPEVSFTEPMVRPEIKYFWKNGYTHAIEQFERMAELLRDVGKGDVLQATGLEELLQVELRGLRLPERCLLYTSDCKISKDMDRLMERRNSRNEMPMDE